MRERRQHLRSRSIFELEIFDTDAMRVIGYLFDVSSGGLGLLSDDSIKSGHVFHLELVVPMGEGVEEKIAFDARSVWCRKAPEAELYHTGFQMMEASIRDSDAFQRLLEDDFLLVRQET